MITTVELCKNIYVLCEPFEANIYWENSSGRFPAWAAFGEVPNLARETKRNFLPVETQLLSNTFGGKNPLLFIDPVALPREHYIWEFARIAQGLKGYVHAFDIENE